MALAAQVVDSKVVLRDLRRELVFVHRLAPWRAGHALAEVPLEEPLLLLPLP